MISIKWFMNSKKPLISQMNDLIKLGLKPLDSLHLGCTIFSKCDYFITVDKGILKKSKVIRDISILNPIELIYRLEEDLFKQ